MLERVLRKLGYVKFDGSTETKELQELSKKLQDQMMENLSSYEEAISQEKYGSLMREVHMMEKHSTDLQDIAARARGGKRVVEFTQEKLQRVTNRILDAENVAENWGKK